MGSQHTLRLRCTAAEGLRSEEDVSQKDPHTLFLARRLARILSIPFHCFRSFGADVSVRAGACPADRRHAARAETHLEAVAIDDGGSVLTKPRANGWVLDEQVTFFAPEEKAHVRLLLDQIVLNSPRWS
jgi:hypothetical protein